MHTCRLAFALIFIAVPQAHAAQDSPERGTIELNLGRCRQLALERNLSFRVSRLAPASSALAVSSSRAVFDPTFTARVSGSQSKPADRLVEDPTSGGYLVTSYPISRSASSSVGLSKGFAFGTDMSLNLSNSWSKASGKQNYGSDLTFDITQPILRGYGREVNESGLRIARNNLDASMSQLETDAISTIRQVEEAYWDLVNAVEGRNVAELSLQYAQQLLERSRARAQSGAQAEREVLQAEYGVATARQSIIAAEASVRGAEDRLKQLTNLVADPNTWDLTITTVDTPHVERSLPPADTLLAVAMRNSRDLYRQRKVIESRHLTLRVRRNTLLPRLDAGASVILKDGGPQIGRSIDDIPTAKFPTWSANLSLTIPVGNRTAEANYRQAALDLKAAEIQLESAELQIRADVRAAVRRVETSREQLAAAQESRRLQEANLASEQERLRLGLTTTYDVLRFERDLADARRSVLQARIEHEKALLALDVATGRLLQTRNIVIERETE